MIHDKIAILPIHWWQPIQHGRATVPDTLLNQMVKMLIGTTRLIMLRPYPIRALTVFIDSKHYSALQISI